MKKSNLVKKKRKREDEQVENSNTNIKTKKNNQERSNNSNLPNKSSNLTKNKFVICHQKKLTFKSKIESNKECVICLRPIVFNDRIFLRCGHVFHENCIGKWLTTRRICPVCKVDIENFYDEDGDSNYSDIPENDENITQVDYSNYIESNSSENYDSDHSENYISENSPSLNQNHNENLISENLQLISSHETGKSSNVNEKLNRILNIGYDGLKIIIKVTFRTLIRKLFIFDRIFI